MVTDRPYRKRLGLDETKAELKQLAGTKYDPAVVEAFLRVLAEKEERHAPPPKNLVGGQAASQDPS
jgi:HD-GYP domain-containing protein (c-di-GMP phosphodiesterase class II)